MEYFDHSKQNKIKLTTLSEKPTSFCNKLIALHNPQCTEGAGKRINLLKLFPTLFNSHRTIHKLTSHSLSMITSLKSAKHLLLFLSKQSFNQPNFYEDMARHCIYVSGFRAQVAECNAVGKHHVIREVAKCLFIHLIILKELENTFLHGKVSTITLLKKKI